MNKDPHRILCVYTKFPDGTIKCDHRPHHDFGHAECDKHHGSKEHTIENLGPNSALKIIYPSGLEMEGCLGCGETVSNHSQIGFKECRIRFAVQIAESNGGFDGAHHKQWVIDQMLFALLGKEKYGEWLKGMNSDPAYDDWDHGVAP